MARKKNAGHSNFMGKVHALLAKGYPLENARRIVGAMVRDAKEATGYVTKKVKAKRAAVLKRACELHETMK